MAATTPRMIITTFGVPTRDVKINKIDLVPEMASDSQGGYVLTSSSIWDANYVPYQAFDKNKHSLYDSTFATAEGTTTGWIQVEFPQKEIVTEFSLQARATGLDSSRTNFIDFQLLGSNDGTNFNTLFSITDEPAWYAGEIREYELTSKNRYKYYRLNVSKSSGTPYVDIQEIGLFKIAKEQYIIKTEPTYYMELNQDAYVNEYCDIYSTDEKIVGRWIDGKPIYQITINCGVLPNTRDKDIAHNVSNIDYVINAFGIGINSNNGYSIIIGGTGTNSNHASDVGLYANRSIIKVRAYDDRSAYTGYVTIQYTKTTDAPNSFDYGMIMNQFAQEALVDVAVTDAEVDKCFE